MKNMKKFAALALCAAMTASSDGRSNRICQ